MAFHSLVSSNYFLALVYPRTFRETLSVHGDSRKTRLDCSSRSLSVVPMYEPVCSLRKTSYFCFFYFITHVETTFVNHHVPLEKRTEFVWQIFTCMRGLSA